MFRILNIAGALTSYQSFLEKGSTLNLNKGEKIFLLFFLRLYQALLRLSFPYMLPEMEMQTPTFCAFKFNVDRLVSM